MDSGERGYYYASPGAENLIGWQINRTWEQVPDYYPVSRFRAQFYRPDIISRILLDLDEDQAISNANRAINKRSLNEDIKGWLPPVVRIKSPATYSTATSDTITVEYEVRSPTGQPIRRVFTQVDGRPIDGAENVEIILGKDNKATGRIEVPLPPHDTTVSLIAETDRVASVAVDIRILRVQEVQQAIKPKLFAALVGIGSYADKSVPTLGRAPVNDVRMMAERLYKEQGKAFDTVELTRLEDSEATQTSILNALQWLHSKVRDRNDIAMFYFSGHGMSVTGSGSYILPVEYDHDRDIPTMINKVAIIDALKRINGNVLVFLDACHASGGLDFGKILGARNLDTVGVIADFAASENGIITFASSTGEELSYLGPKNSYFTEALLEAMDGAANPQDRVVRSDNVIGWLRARVSYLVGLEKKVQTPIMAMSPHARPVAIAVLNY